MTTLEKLKSHPHGRRRLKRVGRGPGSGTGKTSGRGHKGQKQRGPGARPGFEGGQMPLIRSIPKRGFTFQPRPSHQIVNVGRLEGLGSDGSWIEPAVLYEKGLVSKKDMPIKILGDGELKSPVKVRSHAFSGSAKEKIEKAGGQVEVIATRPEGPRKQSERPRRSVRPPAADSQ